VELGIHFRTKQRVAIRTLFFDGENFWPSCVLVDLQNMRRASRPQQGFFLLEVRLNTVVALEHPDAREQQNPAEHIQNPVNCSMSAAPKRS